MTNFRVGLTGGIGSGKSTVAAMFRELGAAVIDTDAISHELTRPGGAAIAAIRAAFGDDFIGPDGAMNRPRMRALVFSDADAKNRLEAILHPMIRKRMLDEAQNAQTPYALLVIPLLFEAADYRERVNRSLVVDCAESTQVARAMRRSGLSEPEVRAILAGQVTRAERLQLADDVIENDAGLDALKPQVARLHGRYLAISSGSN